jgi:hypothetical protein
MPSARHQEPLDFSAPVGSRVRALTAFTFAIVPVAIVINLAVRDFLRLPAQTVLVMVLAPLIAYLVIVPVAYFSRVLLYRLTPDELQVVRPSRVNRFPLRGLSGAEADRHAMAWSFKIIGNDGLGAITGRYRNSRLGSFHALVTDRDHAVILRWPERTLVVSPDRPEEFAERILARAAALR